MSISWQELPDVYDVLKTKKDVARLRGEVMRLERQIEDKDDELKEQYPRNPGARRKHMRDLLDQLTSKKIELLERIADEEFEKMRADVYRSLNYKKYDL